MQSERNVGRFPGLDGLRAIALLAVLFFHLDTKPYIPGGFVGVDLFFVLSGFLITTLLDREFQAHGKIDLMAFYTRRLRRLVPALVVALVLVIGVSLYVIPVDSRLHPELETLNYSILGALAYGFNWLVAFDLPFMRALIHVWSLSIEEQFYLLWPPLYLALRHKGVAPRRLRQFLIAAIVLSLSIPFWYWDWDWKRLYYGSDYRAHALLAGCLLASIRGDATLRSSLAQSPLLAPIAAASVGVLMAIAATAKLHTGLLYMGGFAIVVAASAILVFWAVETPRTHPALRFLESKALVWLGRRSYGAYLFHMPLVIWTRRLDLPVWEQVVGVCLATLLLTEFSYRVIERPIMERRAARKSVKPLPASLRTAAA
jgi:peptidoglycan/LPS O-acetylase OafA/YrhL